MSGSGWMVRRRRAGWVLAGLAGVVGVAGIGLQAGPARPAFDARVLTAVGIMLLGCAVALLAQGGVFGARGRSVIEEHDERNVMLRRLAGSSAFVVSAALSCGLLLWVSLAANGQLPSLSTEVLWWALAVVFLVPFVAYVARYVHAQHRM